MDVHFSSADQTWTTPRWLFRELDAEFGFTLDVASSDDNALCEQRFTPETNGLAQDWLTAAAGGSAFCNPPYRTVAKWIEKAAAEAARGLTVVMLIPARPDTDAFHKHIINKSNVEVRWLKGRLKFGNATNSAPFPSCVVIFRPKVV
ncbi:MAG: DNA N-6-adenine-methyltransferase [Dehalococcoidia bacterium]